MTAMVVLQGRPQEPSNRPRAPPSSRGSVATPGSDPDLFPWYVAVLCLLSFVVHLRLPEAVEQPLET